MSIASEITRLQGVKSDILTAIADKGVTVPTGSMLDDCPDLIASISGGGDLPEGYKQCLYIKNLAQGFIYSHFSGDYIFTNVSKNDKIKCYYEVGDIGTSWIPDVSIIGYYFSDTNSNRSLRVRTNSSETRSIVNGFEKQINFSEIIESCKITKTYEGLTVNGSYISDQYIGNNAIGISTIFVVNNNTIINGKLYYIKIYDNNDKLKYNFIPAKKNDSIDVLLETKTGYEFVLDTSKFICGPVID